MPDVPHDDEARPSDDAGTEQPASQHVDAVPSSQEPSPSESDSETPPATELGPKTWREIGKDFLKPGRGQVILAAILLVVAMAMVMQFRTNTAAAPYENMRRTDLVQLLDNLNQESSRLSEEISEQEEVKRQLESGAGTEEVARTEAKARLETLQILAGTVPATGPGIRLVINDPQKKLTADVVLNAVEELRDAGAEVIEINDSARVVASTWIAAGDDGIMVDGKAMKTPITIDAIGDPHALEEGARFRGGLVSEVEGPRVGGSVTITSSQSVDISSVHTAPSNQYARPA